MAQDDDGISDSSGEDGLLITCVKKKPVINLTKTTISKQPTITEAIKVAGKVFLVTWHTVPFPVPIPT